MTAPHHAGLAAKFLRDMTRDMTKVSGAPPSAEARDAAISAIERAIVARKRRARARVWLIAGGATAAAAALLLGVVKVSSIVGAGGASAVAAPMLAHPTGEVSVTAADGTRSASLHEGDLVSRGQRLTTPEGAKVVLAHVTGTELTLNGASELSVIDDGPRRVYALGRGLLDLRVAKLKANERLLVQTKDAEVEVRGTRFHVEVVDPRVSCDGRATRVSVDEGVVVVRRDGAEARVTAGQSWPTCTRDPGAIGVGNGVTSPSPTPDGVTDGAQEAPPATSTPNDVAPAPSSTSGTGGGPRSDARGLGTSNALGNGSGDPRDGARDSRPSSTLEEQNDLFAEGIDKKKSGDMAGAAAAFQRLLVKYPQSPLAESAAAGRLKALRASDPARAKTAAREYLARWPHFIAREDAESVLRDGP